ncbi:ORF1076 [White spot syndrome virus]|uniref:Wsv221 n=4 Tax=White spot syndrome virus TaxID=342409 RepID=Q8VAZ4_WSSVS|nr:wsv221 [Shrimp white spot syndrome virus]AFX59598.1 wsv221 [White spot syndrome virus]AAL33225.1 wsv221 [Shrimp white spot syndrome virus]AAL89144.1 WSSV276 [Shrimp white spot syndrome virus]ATU83441.1 ORF1076 [White spot syndrome virus]AWQ60392.1 wsv221 [Shrimp white spot syndrome virus]
MAGALQQGCNSKQLQSDTYGNRRGLLLSVTKDVMASLSRFSSTTSLASSRPHIFLNAYVLLRIKDVEEVRAQQATSVVSSSLSPMFISNSSFFVFFSNKPNEENVLFLSFSSPVSLTDFTSIFVPASSSSRARPSKIFVQNSADWKVIRLVTAVVKELISSKIGCRAPLLVLIASLIKVSSVTGSVLLLLLLLITGHDVILVLTHSVSKRTGGKLSTTTTRSLFTLTLSAPEKDSFFEWRKITNLTTNMNHSSLLYRFNQKHHLRPSSK